MPIEIKLAYGDTENIEELFAEYTAALSGMEDNFKQYLQIQDYDSELDNLNEKYGLPQGRLYIVYAEGQAAGCIALRRLSDTECEMKRLYVRPQFRGRGTGKALVDIIVRDAREIGYAHMLLDTLPALAWALKLYENAGFYRIPPYNESPVEKTIFMRLDL
ncbi:MAG: GNAT family N-acetyltransferase [Clostridiales bacterium]|nr:GNAT family N-acetyltransferase [Clostridiales bacterium]